MKLPEYRNSGPLYHSPDQPFIWFKIIGGLILLVVCVGMVLASLLIFLAGLFH